MRRDTLLLFTGLCLLVAAVAWAGAPTNINDFFMPGSQPGQSGQLETPDKCDNCHGGYNTAVEPAYNWRGSMMAQAARDPLFYACLAVANQDAPESGDLCIRCHSPSGWLEGRSIPTDGSALNGNDRQGVQCDFCHKLVKPTALNLNPYPGDAAYTSGTYPRDQSYLGSITAIPPTSANGMYVCDVSNAKRGPFVDAMARHQMYYSPYHRDAELCGTCHDVSNPVFSRQTDNTYGPNAFGQPAPSFDPYQMGPVERTFSEWKNSAYAQGGVSAPQFGGNKTVVSTCQDCHLRDVTGLGCNKAGAPVRTDLPLHDMTGGNTAVPAMVAALYPAEVNTAALNAGVARATDMLKKAATLNLTVTPQGTGYLARVRVTNETGHKLLSGYPEGRRMWIQLRAYDAAGSVIYESGGYDPVTATLSQDPALKVYEIHGGISETLAAALGLPPGKSFHFVLNDYVVVDNRIPPRGFTNAAFAAIQSPPVGYSYADGQYWDDTDYALPANTTLVTATLYYQATSREYVEFLRDENHTNTAGQTLYDLWSTTGKSAPVAMASKSFSLGATNDTQPPSVPTNLIARAISSSQIDLTWSASTDNVGVTGYNVYRGGVLVGTATTTAYSDKGLSATTTYSYTVKAYDAAGNLSAASNTATATTKKAGRLAATPVDAPDLSARLDRDGTVRFSHAVAEAGEVRIQIYDVGGRLVDVLTENVPAGHGELRWSPGAVPSGLYLARMSHRGATVTTKFFIGR